MSVVSSDVPDREQPTFQTIFILLISGLECAVGVIGNGFIAAIHGTAWARRRRVPLCDRILLFLSVSRILLQIWMMVENTYSLLLWRAYSQNTVYTLFKVILMFLNYANLWLAAWLNVFYCLRIAHFTHRLFSLLRRKVVALMPWLLRLSLLACLCFSLPFSRDIFQVYANSSVPVPTLNATEKKFFYETNLAGLVLLMYLGICVPLVLFVLAAALLILSLRRHSRLMRSKASGSRDPSMEAHLGAIKALSYFLVLYILNAIALFLSMSNLLGPTSTWNIVCKVIMAAYPAGHSVLLILSNPGLRRAWKRC
ncbi:taste receptor type 2 member 40 [Sorex araneus]|uniref:taste receptor type 2 member 40 n=1 Tax=Sorex araneus TaxID=42254 RepID=UPI00033167F3|nr:taste receptor type 2 member 40 [Sorex araneus]